RAARRAGEPPRRGAPWSYPDGLAGLEARLLAAVGQTGSSAGRVVELEILSAGAGVLVRDELGAAPKFDAALLVLPARVLGGISLLGTGGVSLAPLASVPHASLVTVSLGYRRDQIGHPLDGQGLLVPSIERRKILAI